MPGCVLSALRATLTQIKQPSKKRSQRLPVRRRLPYGGETKQRVTRGWGTTMETITARIDRITQLTPEYRSATPPAPKSVKIEVTARCDFRCFFCASAMRLRKTADMSWNFYTRIVKEMRELGIEELGVFYLGESFICDWLADAIRYAKRECGYPYVFLTTNGRLANPGRVRECISAGLDSLKFSFNFSDPQQFQDVTRVKADEFYTVVDNLKFAQMVRDNVLIETGHHCGIYASSILYDGEQRGRMQDAVAEILPYVDEHYWLPLYGYPGLTECTGDARPAAGTADRDGVLSKPLPCWSLFTEGHITYDGRLSACCFDHASRFDMGDLNEMSFLDAWHGRAFQALRAAHLKGEVTGTACEKCIAYD